MKKLLAILLVALVAFSAVGCGSSGTSSASSDSAKTQASDNSGSAAAKPAESSDEVYIMRIGYATTNDSQDNNAQLFKKYVEEKTNGRLKVELYPGSQLGTNAKVVDSVMNGTIEGSFQPTAFLGGFDPVLNVGDLPFFWPDQNVMLDILNNSEIAKQFSARAESKGVKIVGYVNQGAKQIVSNAPISGMSDMNGKKFRVMGAPVLDTMVTDWGASSIPLALSEVFTALQQKTVDGIEQTVELTYLMSNYEAAPYILLTNHGLLPEAIMLNLDWYNGLPEDIRSAIDEVAHFSYLEGAVWCDEHNAAALETMKNENLITVSEPSEESLAQFKAAAEITYQKYLEANPEAQVFFDGFKEEIAKRVG